MDFTFSDEQRMMAASTRELLADVCSPAVLRAVAEGRDASGAARWERYCELGLPGLLAPESAGGVGLSNVDFVLIAEELGRAAVPEALVEHAAVGVPLLAEFAGELRVQPVLEAAAAGACATGGRAAAGAVRCRSRRGRLAGGRRRRRTAPRAAIRVCGSSSSRRMIACGDCTASSTRPCRRLGSPRVPAVREACSRAVDRGALHAAAQCLGVAERMLEIAVAYASDRKQFGQAIGAYQGLKHQFASAQVKVEFARPVVYAAAASLGESGEKMPVAVSHAKLAAVAAADACARIAMQAHGAMGYSWEVDLHFYMKRAWALAGAWGDGNLHARRVQAALWSGAQPLGPAHTFAATEG